MPRGFLNLEVPLTLVSTAWKFKADSYCKNTVRVPSSHRHEGKWALLKTAFSTVLRKSLAKGRAQMESNGLL